MRGVNSKTHASNRKPPWRLNASQGGFHSLHTPHFLTCRIKQKKLSATAIRKKMEWLLSLADIKVGGRRPWDILVHNDNFYPRVLGSGSLGLGESYMDGWWDCPELDEFIFRIFRFDLENRVTSFQDYYDVVRARLFNLQKPSLASKAARHHYDIGNDLYRCMLDKLMMYSCGYWKDALNLDEAQEAKIDLICRKLGVMKGMKILDIGCGWGGADRYIADKYGARVVGITVSREQARLAQETCRGYPVEIRLQDYHELKGKFDRIFSIGMFEHVGYKNYRAFMKIVHGLLAKNGLFLLHTIGTNKTLTTTDPWIQRYIFPNAVLPSEKQISDATEGRFVLEDWHSFGADYDKTLMQWYRNFSGNWKNIKDRHGERFFRMWKYYLLACAAAFRARKNQLWQLVLSPKGIVGGYRAPR